MKFYPVIMCGGSGTRLWPLSRPTRPKQFIPLVGDRSPFQATLLRLARLPQAAQPIVVAGLAHAGWIGREAADIGVVADVLLEPQARDSAAAVAAAAAWVADRDPSGVVVIVASDHHIPDDQAFVDAVVTAGAAAAQGWVVTLGVDPTSPATAYGYIRPGDGLTGLGAVRRNAAFVEKPDAVTAAAHVRSGYLWNSGNFIARADVLMRELDQHEPAVAAAVRAAVSTGEALDDGFRLGSVFAEAPKISFDYAVMERTAHAAVLPVSFAWSDLGAWDAVWAASPKDERGNSVDPGVLLQDADDCLVRVGGGLQVAVLGAKRLAVIGDSQSILICDLEASQGVKLVAEAAARAASETPAKLSPSNDLAAWSDRYDRWFRTAALPLWWTLGGDHINGGFHELVGLDGVAPVASKRARVQARQVFVYARSARLGLAGPWLHAAEHGWRFFEKAYRRPDGLFRTLVSPVGEPLNETAYLYDQVFALMALAALQEAGPERGDWEGQAEALLAKIKSGFGHARGYREAGDHPFQSNAQMHLFEAALAWIEAGGGPIWRDLADELIGLALDRFIDSAGMLREFYQGDWAPAAGGAGRVVEPGHQFEWAWLLDRWAHMVGSRPAAAAAHNLFRTGMAGWDSRRGVAVDELDDAQRIARPTARLWPQTELLKAAVLLGRGDSPQPAAYAQHAADAAAGLWRYLETPVAGLWRDKMSASGEFVAEPAPASTFYHLFGAVQALRRFQPRLMQDHTDVSAGPEPSPSTSPPAGLARVG